MKEEDANHLAAIAPEAAMTATIDNHSIEQLPVSQAPHRDVIFIHSDAYFRALGRLPVHRQREQMTLALLFALSEAHSTTTTSSHKKLEERSTTEQLEPDARGPPRLRETHAYPFGMQFIAPSLATEDQLMRFHAKDYIATLRRTTEKEGDEDTEASSSIQSSSITSSTTTKQQKQQQATDQVHQEFELVDDAYVFPGLYEYCRFVAGASLTAADALRHLITKWEHTKHKAATTAAEGPAAAVTVPAPAPVAINLGGGRHHAMRSSASGFCYVNDVVLAIQRLQSPSASSSSSVTSTAHQVLCIDIDVHHGDGVQEAFYFSHKVTTLSFHLHEPTFFPGTGASNEIGAGRGKYHTVNVPLQRGITDDQFEKLFEKVVTKAIEAVAPQVIVLICGVDTLAKDPLGGFNLTSRGISNCVKMLMMESNLPLLLLGGGGYSGADACRALATVVTSVAAPELEIAAVEVPEHLFYEEYKPDFQMETKPAIHRTNANTQDSLDAVASQAIAVLEQAQQQQSARKQQATGITTKRKRA